jgi:hypothetical protein
MAPPAGRDDRSATRHQSRAAAGHGCCLTDWASAWAAPPVAASIRCLTPVPQYLHPYPTNLFRFCYQCLPFSCSFRITNFKQPADVLNNKKYADTNPSDPMNGKNGQMKILDIPGYL